MAEKKVIIVGAGPGGLAASLILAHRGFKVTVVEKLDRVGGRNSEVTLGDYSFDLGPTFLMMKFILDEVFEEAELSSKDYMDFVKLDPMYRLVFPDNEVDATMDREEMKSRLDKAFPGSAEGYDRFLKEEAKRFDMVFPCLQKDYNSLSEFFTPHISKGHTISCH